MPQDVQSISCTKTGISNCDRKSTTAKVYKNQLVESLRLAETLVQGRGHGREYAVDVPVNLTMAMLEVLSSSDVHRRQRESTSSSGSENNGSDVDKDFVSVQLENSHTIAYFVMPIIPEGAYYID